jgi:hypothetical protein
MSGLRKVYHKGKLSDEQIRRLKELGFSFYPDEERWQNRYRELTEYVSNGGDPNRIPTNNHLRSWTRNIVLSYQNGKLSKDRIHLMEKLGVKWDDVGYLNEKWEEYFNIVVEYFKTNEVNSLPAAHPIYSWWKIQLKRINKLSQEKAEKIRSLRPIRKAHRWSELEKKIVRENSGKPAEELAELIIGRTPESIQKLREKYGW